MRRLTEAAAERSSRKWLIALFSHGRPDDGGAHQTTSARHAGQAVRAADDAGKSLESVVPPHGALLSQITLDGVWLLKAAKR